MRISRARPNIRTALYWALRTKVGKESTAAIKAKPVAEGEKQKKPPRPKRLEKLLHLIWKNYLKEENPALAAA